MANKTNGKRQTFWTEARVERLKKLFSQYSTKEAWSLKISKQFKSAVTPNAVYKKAARIGLSKPVWALKEVDKSATAKAVNNAKSIVTK